MQWVSASMPVAAVIPGGRSSVSSGSANTALASRVGENTIFLMCVASSETTLERPTSEPVPAVVGSDDATHVLEDGEVVTVSCAEGDACLVYRGEVQWVEDAIDVSDIPETDTKVIDPAFAAFGPIGFDDKGDVEGASYVMYEWDSGQYVEKGS